MGKKKGIGFYLLSSNTSKRAASITHVPEKILYDYNPTFLSLLHGRDYNTDFMTGDWLSSNQKASFIDVCWPKNINKPNNCAFFSTTAPSISLEET